MLFIVWFLKFKIIQDSLVKFQSFLSPINLFAAQVDKDKRNVFVEPGILDTMALEMEPDISSKRRILLNRVLLIWPQLSSQMCINYS